VDPIELINAGKIKRFFRATRKLNTPNLIYHITQRAAGSEPLFIEDKDYLFMLGLLKEIAQDNELRIYAFCLMPNHVHLLLSPIEENLSDAMRDLFARYAMKFNRKYERKGHLFGGPYRQAVCLQNSYVLAASLYIHMNPVKAELTNNPLEYRWSSIRLYYEDGAPKSFLNPEFILSLLSENEVDGKRRYRNLLNEGSELHVGHVLEQEDAIEEFKSKLASMSSSLFRRLDKKKRIGTISGMDSLTIEEMEEQIKRVKGAYPFNKPSGKKARKHLIEQLIARGYKRVEIAERLGVSIKTVYNILKS
jgi:putative transposase